MKRVSQKDWQDAPHFFGVVGGNSEFDSSCSAPTTHPIRLCVALVLRLSKHLLVPHQSLVAPPCLRLAELILSSDVRRPTSDCLLWPPDIRSARSQRKKRGQTSRPGTESSNVRSELSLKTQARNCLVDASPPALVQPVFRSAESRQTWLFLGLAICTPVCCPVVLFLRSLATFLFLTTNCNSVRNRI